jgi:hypothetical protein
VPHHTRLDGAAGSGGVALILTVKDRILRIELAQSPRSPCKLPETKQCLGSRALRLLQAVGRFYSPAVTQKDHGGGNRRVILRRHSRDRLQAVVLNATRFISSDQVSGLGRKKDFSPHLPNNSGSLARPQGAVCQSQNFNDGKI